MVQPPFRRYKMSFTPSYFSRFAACYSPRPLPALLAPHCPICQPWRVGGDRTTAHNPGSGGRGDRSKKERERGPRPFYFLFSVPPFTEFFRSLFSRPAAIPRPFNPGAESTGCRSLTSAPSSISLQHRINLWGREGRGRYWWQPQEEHNRPPPPPCKLTTYENWNLAE